MYIIYIYRYIWLYMNMWFHIWTMVYFLIYNVYIYICTCDSCIYIYIHCANDMYMSIKRIYTCSGRYLVHKNCNSKGENSSFPNWQTWRISPSGCPGIMYVLPYMYDRIYIYTYAYACAGILLSHYSRKQLTLCRGGSHPSWW